MVNPSEIGPSGINLDSLSAQKFGDYFSSINRTAQAEASMAEEHDFSVVGFIWHLKVSSAYEIF